MLGHALCHALSFHSQTITHSITNNQSYYQNNQSYWKTINPTTDLLLLGKISFPYTTFGNPKKWKNTKSGLVPISRKNKLADLYLVFPARLEACPKAFRFVRIPLLNAPCRNETFRHFNQFHQTVTMETMTITKIST